MPRCIDTEKHHVMYLVLTMFLWHGSMSAFSLLQMRNRGTTELVKLAQVCTAARLRLGAKVSRACQSTQQESTPADRGPISQEAGLPCSEGKSLWCHCFISSNWQNLVGRMGLPRGSGGKLVLVSYPLWASTSWDKGRLFPVQGISGVLINHYTLLRACLKWG